MKIYIKKSDNYTPICIQDGDNYSIYLSNLRYSGYLNINEQFDFEKLLNLETIYRRCYIRANDLVIGKGLIFILNSGNWRLFGVVVNTHDGTINILVDSSIIEKYPSEFKRLKTAMNIYGISSRKQTKIVNNLQEMFTFDPLQPSLADYSSNVQEELSKEFLTQLEV